MLKAIKTFSLKVTDEEDTLDQRFLTLATLIRCLGSGLIQYLKVMCMCDTCPNFIKVV